MSKRIRIGNGCGFWGDNLDAPRILAEKGDLDYLTLEYLAELTMSILALQKQKSPEAGYATDFVQVINSLIPAIQSQPKLRIITNAGGMNPLVCGHKVRELLNKNGLTDCKIGVIAGDDLLPRLTSLLEQGQPLNHLDTGQPLASVLDRVVSANAYLGSDGIVTALQNNARIVITGRVADAALTLAPAMFEFGWHPNDVDRLCAGAIAGHLIECGAQVTGGLWCHWQETNLDDVGYPIAEMNADGTFVITKPNNTGGRVNRETLIEQLLYEVADPAAYLTPDVVADFTSVQIVDHGDDRVEVSGAKGKPAPASYKVSIAYREGWTAAGTLVIAGPQAASKARRAGEMLLARLNASGNAPQHSYIECLGTGDSLPGVLPISDPAEVVLRVAVRDSRRAVVERFSREFAPLVTSGPPGVTGYTTGRPSVREVFAYWPALLRREHATSSVQYL
jgi:hypothetical protein